MTNIATPRTLPSEDAPSPFLELPDWHLRAECRGSDTDLFFPDRGESTRKAKAMCAGCPVRVECLDWALDNSERFGIWGGLSERDRRAVRKARRAA